mmetsp:Transcript_17017/g.54250  ORF Transcript_17017/g.54250 Transcript_17017/m.54250 type:complete len:604 (-) Transcript_17017:2868-4679(-)
MALDHHRVLGLAEDLQEVVVADEVEAREHRALLLEEVGERALADVKLVHHLGEGVPEAGHLREGGHEGVALDGAHELAELRVDLLEAPLLVGERAAPEDGLQIHPLALHLVERAHALGEGGELVLPALRLLFEGPEERRLPKALHQALVVPDLGHDVLPLFDEAALAARLALVLGEVEPPLHAPRLQLVERLPQGHLALGLRMQVLNILGLLGELLRRVEEVLELEVVLSLSFRAAGREVEHPKQLAPVVVLPAVPANELEVRQRLAVLIDLLEEDERHGVLGGGALDALRPLGEEVVHVVQLVADGEPISVRQLGFLLVELREALPAAARTLDVGGDLVEEGQVGGLHGEVFAVPLELVALLPHLRQHRLHVLHLCEGHLRVPLRRPAGLEVVPLLLEGEYLGTEVHNLLVDLALELVLLVVEVALVLLQLCGEVLPLVGQRGHVYNRCHAAAAPAAARHGAQELVLLLHLTAELHDLLHTAHQPLGRRARLADLLDAVGLLVEGALALVDEAFHLILLGLRLAAQHGDEGLLQGLHLLVDGLLYGEEGDRVAVHLDLWGELLGLLARRLEHLEVHLPVGHLIEVVLEEVLEVDGAERHPVR